MISRDGVKCIPTMFKSRVSERHPNPLGVIHTSAPGKVRLSLGAGLLLSLASCGFNASPPERIAAEAKELNLAVREERLPEVSLRGYGRLSADVASYKSSATGDVGSILTIHAASEEKAKIIHAKYVSDLRSLGAAAPKTLGVNGTDVPATVIDGQGTVLALRHGRDVSVITSKTDGDALALLLRTKLDKLAGVEYAPSAEVPMFLDSWDRLGFRFYYRPWETPKDVKWKDYKVMGEFDFAKKENNAGFVFWAETSLVDNAVGLDNDVWWDWGARAAIRRNLPIVINTSGGAATWLLNGERGQLMSLMPQYCGSYHSVADTWSAGMRNTSWCATEGKDKELAPVRRIVSRYSKIPNTLEFLEPHGELRHGDYDIFLEYGPVADASFRVFLKEKYGSTGTVAERWGMADALTSWDDVRVPDLATFLGYGPEALDLTGTWRIGYEPKPEQPAEGQKKEQGPNPIRAPAEWFGEKFDDSSWPSLTAPGNDLMMLLEKKPAVFRRSFDVPKDWLAKDGKVWLYVWDLNSGEHMKDKVAASLNGVMIGEDLTRHATSHWAAFEATAALRAGANTVAIRVPKGFLGYHVYLSKHEPKQYPDLPDAVKARWVDFADWRQWTRIEAARRGMEAIRSVDPDRSIICMAPDSTISGLKKLCETYGGHFHNTGHMGAFWNEFLPMLMRGADLPFSLEPGGPAHDLKGFKHMMGLYFTEGIQAIHYFIHVGDIYWPDEIRQHFERIQPLINTVGKVHAPKNEIAMLFSDRIDNITGFPWGKNPDANLPSGYWPWPLNGSFSGRYDFDAVTDLDFGKGGAAQPYKIIIGANISVMDEKLTKGVEEWVRNGGIFVAFVQTGRHTPEQKDAWPISKLSGYEVAGISRSKPTPNDPSEVADWWNFTFAPGQKVFKESEWELKNIKANGLKLKRLADDCQDLALWEDGSTAVGMRPLGKGYVIHMGLKFCREPLWHGWPDRTEKLFRQLFEYAGMKRVPATAEGARFRRYVSNNGLFDYWVLWNEKNDKALDTSLVFRDGFKPTACREVGVDTPTTLASEADGSVAVKGIHIEPLETKMFVTPRNHLSDAPLDWITLQRNWWRGAAEVKPEPAPVMTGRPADAATGQIATLDLTDGWKYKTLDENGTDDPAPLAAAELDDSSWPTRKLECWAVPEELPSRRVMFRRTFQIPAEWQEGGVELWLRSWFHTTVIGKARYWLDGKEVTQGDGGGGLIRYSGLDAGTKHTLAVEIKGEGQVCGVRGNTWLAFTKKPGEVLELAGDWMPTKDYVTSADTAVKLPGAVEKGTKMVTRNVDLPAALAGKQLYLRMKTGHGITGCLVNGRYVRRHHHFLGDVTFLNITPYLNVGKANTLSLLTGDKNEIKELALWVY